MKILSGIAQCLEKLTITGVCRFVGGVMQNAIIKDVVSGPIRTLSRLLNALNVRRDFLSIDPKVVEAELRLAELHQILLLKQENHGLNSFDEQWLKDTQEAFDKRKNQLDLVAIKLELAVARLSERTFVSTVSNTEINLALFQHMKKILDNSKK